MELCYGCNRAVCEEPGAHCCETCRTTIKWVKKFGDEKLYKQVVHGILTPQEGLNKALSGKFSIEG